MRVFVSMLSAALMPLMAYAQASKVEDVQGSTDTVPAENSVAKVLVRPLYLSDPDGAGFSTSFTGATTKLAARWDFENPSPYANKVSGGNALSITGSATTADEAVSRAMMLTGSGYGSAAINATGMTTGQFTVSMWFKIDSGTLGSGTWDYQTLCRLDNLFVSGGWTAVISIGRGNVNTNNSYISIRGMQTANMTAVYNVSPSNGSGIGASQFFLNYMQPRLDDGQWHQLVVTYNAALTAGDGPFAVYLDGGARLSTNTVVGYTSGGVANSGGSIASKTLHFGQNPSNAVAVTSYLKGGLDRLRVYGRTLTGPAAGFASAGSASEVGYLMDQNADGDASIDRVEVATATDALDPNSPTAGPVLDDDGNLAAVTLAKARYATWDFETVGNDGKIKDLSGTNSLTISGATLDNGNGMPSVSARFNGLGILTKDGLDWGTVTNYSISHWIRFEENSPLSTTNSKVALWEMDGVHNTLGNKLILAVSRSAQTGREIFSLTANNGGTGGALLWDTGFGPQMADGNWHHVVLTRNTSTGYRLWVDGIDFGAKTGTAGTYLAWETQSLSGATKNLTLGGQRTGVPLGFVGFQGNIDRMRVWKSVLTAADIANLYYQDYDGDLIPDLTEVQDDSLDPLVGNAPAGPDPTWDQTGFGAAPVTTNLIAHWNFESFKYDGTGRYFENQQAPANYPLRPNTGVSLGFQNALASDYASFHGAGSVSTSLVSGLLNKTTWAMGGWLRVDKDTIWDLPGVPTPLWELQDTQAGVQTGVQDHFRLYAVRGGEFIQIIYVRFDPATGQNDATASATRWVLPRSLRLDDEGWHHVMLQRTGGGYQLSIDNQTIPAAANGAPLLNFTNTANTGTLLRLGSTLYYAAYSGPTREYGLKGAWDRFRVYSASLAPATLTALYRQDADGDGEADIDEFGVLGRSAIDATDDNPTAPPTGVDLANVDIEGVPPLLNSDNKLLGLWDFEQLPDRLTGFADRSPAAKAMRPGGTAAQSGIDVGVGMPSRSAFLRDGGFLSADAAHFVGATDISTSLWVKTEPGLLERNTQGFCIVSYEDLQSPRDANTLSLRLQKSGRSQALVVQNYGTLSGFIQPTPQGAAWSLVERRLDDGNWHHLVWVRSKSGSLLYLDGLQLTTRLDGGNERVLTLAVPQAPATAPKMVLGRVSTRAPGFAFAGNLDRVRSYRRALTAGEVKSLFQQDFDGDGYSDVYELGRFGYDPLAAPPDDPTNPGDPGVDWDDDTGLTAASTLETGLLGQWNFEWESGFEPGDDVNSLRFPAQRPTSLPSAVAQGGVQWNPEDGLLSRSLTLSRDGYVAFPGSLYGAGGSTWSSSFWVRMPKGEIASQASELQSSGEKIALATFGVDRDAMPHFVASINGLNQLVVDSNFLFTGGVPGFSKTTMASWKLPAKLDDGRWHHVVINLSGTTSELFVDGFNSPLASANAGTFSNFGAAAAGAEPYLWLGFRRNTVRAPSNVVVSALPYRGFNGSIDRVRFYQRKLTSTEATNLYFQDRDGDTIPDVTEANNFFRPLIADTVNSALDYDGDGLSTTAELAAGTDWRRPDSDGDWFFDGWEKRWFTGSGLFNPLVSDLAIREGNSDTDALGNWDEFLFGSNPLAGDSDGDGFDDLAEYRAGSDPNSSASQPGGTTHGAMTRAGVLPGGFDEAGPKGGDPSYSYNGSDATGSRYRKVALNGRPLADEAPETEEETDRKNEEVYVDAYSLGLHYDHSLVYVPLGSSELVLQANLSLSEESWSNRSGIRPHESLTNPLGACWSTNLCAYIEEVAEKGGTPDTGATPDPHFTYSVIDEEGHPLKFGSYDNNTIFSYPSSLSDRKNYQHDLRRQSQDTLVLRKKFGTTLTYQLTDLNQAHRANRAGGSSSSILHRYYRLTLVEDRFGNQLKYSYPTSHNKTLIPTSIYDPKRPDQKITVTVDPGNPHRIASITDPRGYTQQFGYQAKTIPSGILAGSATADVLATITDPMAGVLQLGYDAVLETESSGPVTTYYYALNLNQFTDKRGAVTLITYEPDNDKYYTTVSSTEANAKRIYGLPRLVKTVRSAASAPAGMAGEADVEQVAEFARRQGLRWLYTPNGVRMTAGAQGTPTTDWYNEIRDAERNLTTYVFRDVNAIIADTSTHGSDFSLNWLIYYLQMDIIHPDGIGTESYKFDLGSGLSLRETTDICGNPTSYRYSDGWGGVSLAPSTSRNLAIFARWSDPTEKVDALGRVEHFGYSPNFRVMASAKDVHGTVREYVVDRLGRRLSMTATDAGGHKLAEETYGYDDSRFPSFMTRKTIEAFANPSGQTWEGDLITLYQADSNGRPEKEVTDMDRSGTITAGDLVTTYGYDKNGNKVFEINPRGYQTDFVYDPLNRLSRTVFPAAEGPLRNVRAEKVMLYDANGNRHAEIDENGNTTFRLYDALNRMRKEVRDMDGVSGPTKTAVTNLEGGTYYRLDAPGQPIGPDLVSSYDYNDVSSVTSATDRNGIVTFTSRDAIQRPVSVWENWQSGDTEATFGASLEKRLTLYTYDKASNTGGSIFIGDGFKATTVTRKNAVLMATGNYEDVIVTQTYDKVYRLSTETTRYEPGKFTTALTEYDDTNYLETKTIAQGEVNETVSRTRFDGLGRSVEVVKDFGGLNATDLTFYTSTGLVWRALDAENRETQTDYDAAGRATQVWQARSDITPTPGGVAVDRATGLTDEAIGSPVTVTQYDACNNVIGTTNARFKTTTTQYDARNRKIVELMPAVDADGDPTTATTAQPTLTTFYDASGKIAAQSDARQNWTRTFYDRANRVWFIRTNPTTGNPSTIPLPNGNAGDDIFVQSEYDPNGNVIVATDANGAQTRNRYDALNRLVITATDPSDGYPVDPNTAGYSAATYQTSIANTDMVVTHAYDDAGNLIAVTDGKNQSTAFRYDGLARKTRVIWDPSKTLHPTEEFLYDGVVQTRKTNADGHQIQYAYDGLLRVSDVTYPSRTADNRHNTYDLVGNLLTVTYPGEIAANQPVRSVTQTYDALNRLRTETSNGQTHSYTYDKVGNRRTATYGSTGRYLNTLYDALNRVQAIQEKDTSASPGGRSTVYWYDLTGNATVKDLPNDMRTVTTYDFLKRKLGIVEKVRSSGVVNASFDYSQVTSAALPSGYDRAGNLLRTVENYTQAGVKNRLVVNTYDMANRLLTETLDETGAAGELRVTAYTYDKGNNRTRRVKTVNGVTAPGDDITSTYGNGSNGAGSNQLTGYGPTSGAQTVTFAYDANGNRKNLFFAGRTDTYTYDDDNRLIGLSYQSPAVVAQRGTFAYLYDYRTRRVQKSELGTTTDVSYSGGTSVQERIGATLARQYVRGSDYGGGIGGILYSMGADISTASYNQYNSRGDVIGQTGATGNVTWQASYEAYGKRVREAGTTPVADQRANTKDEDPTGLLNEGMRYRDLETGAFITRDPTGFVDGPNVYTYVNQNPWSKMDPDGLFWAFIVDAAFATWDTVQYSRGKIDGEEYTRRMAVTAASVAINAASGGGFTGGGLLVRAATTTARTATVATRTARVLTVAERVAVSTVLQSSSHVSDAAQLGAAVRGAAAGSGGGGGGSEEEGPPPTGSKGGGSGSGGSGGTPPSSPAGQTAKTTGQNSAELGRNMAKEGRAVGEGEAAAHIVPSTATKGHWAKGAESRQLLERYGVNINDAANGARLGHPQPHARLTHTEAFQWETNARLNATKDSMLEAGRGGKAIRKSLREELRAIGRELENAQ